MKVLRNSICFLSKLKASSIAASYARFSVFQRKNSVLRKIDPPSSFSIYKCVSISFPHNVNVISSRQGKLFKEVENEYAHKVMEDMSVYSKSVLKHPLSSNILFSNSENLSSSGDVIDDFVEVTYQSMSEGLTLEHDKFFSLVREICTTIPTASDDGIRTILHHLCLWPLTPSTTSPNFKLLWHALDQECVKRLNRWDVLFRKTFSKMSNNSHFVFLYGTLKKGEPNHHLIEEKTEGKVVFIGKAKTVKKWPLVIASRYNIPYLLYAEGKGMHVIGEVYEVDDVILAKLDELECHPHYYTRLNEEVQMVSEDKVIKPWMYFLKNFRPELCNLQCFSDYSSEGSHGLKYVPRYNRPPSGENYYSDVMNV